MTRIMGLLSKFLKKLGLIEIVQHCSENNILDLGCGRADILMNLPEECKYCGIDRDSEAIKDNQIKYPQQKFFLVELKYP
jgi:ubiquinone/menaquinone biosynthesis C-methylase UbiE